MGQEAGVSFLPAVTYGTGGAYAYYVAVADVNGDSRPDMVVANGNGGATGTVGVLLGNGDGTFQTVKLYNAGGNQTGFVAVADVNGDHKLDLITANSNGTPTVGILLGNGDGSFQHAVAYGSGGGVAASIAVADVNHDKHPDILVAEYSSSDGKGAVGVLLGNGDGTFRRAAKYSSGGYYPKSILARNLTNGEIDVMVTNACGSQPDCSGHGSVSLLRGRGDGTFQRIAAYDSGGLGALAAVLADVNGDGKLDLVVTNSNSTLTADCGLGTVAVLLGNGYRTFEPAVVYGSGGYAAYFLALADLNGDGKLDVAVTNFCPLSSAGDCAILGQSGLVGVLQGNGDGTFQSASTYSSNGYWIADAIAAADVNGDGKPDLLVVNLSGDSAGEGSVGVLINSN